MAGFLDKIFSLFGSDDTESSKKKLIKQLAKDLSKNKYGRFYRVKGEEITPAFAKFFYDVYKIVSPAQVFLQNAEKSDQLKQLTVEFFMDKKILALQSRISKESIEERSKGAQTASLAKQVREELNQFITGFDSQRFKAIDECYRLIMAFVKFTGFDFFFLLKKFDANISERNFSYQPRFDAIRAEYVSDDIKDFLEVAAAVDPDQDWKTALEVLKKYKNGMDVVNQAHWIKLLAFLKEIRRSKIFELLVRHIDKDPLWQSVPRIPDDNIVDPYIQKKKNETEAALNSIQNSRRNAQITQLAQTVFGSADVQRMKNYTDKQNEIYLKKDLEGFTYVQGMNYLKAFLLDYFKKDIRELCDLFLIRGQWVSQVLSQQMSEGFHVLMNISEKILVFDDKLGENGENGSRLKAALVKVDRDKGQAKYVRIILQAANEEALQMITKSAQALIVIGKHLKSILEDFQKSPHELIINWKELESSSETPLAGRIAGIYKKIYCFVQMMQFFAQEGGNEA
ncbi:MAG: DUF5312 domain-containing protein [Spirochaetaceae bacterium]|jgi:hypothetical protein|nr:DUF5312 domain-containing protein [Spirochaetaceae bacterium]